MGRPPYVCFEEYKAIFAIPLGDERFKKLKVAADAGNIQAAFTYGEILMTGGWDQRRMEIDLACGRLLPETPNPRNDPYLCVPRDQFTAINFLIIIMSNTLVVIWKEQVGTFCTVKRREISSTILKIVSHFFTAVLLKPDIKMLRLKMSLLIPLCRSPKSDPKYSISKQNCLPMWPLSAKLEHMLSF